MFLPGILVHTVSDGIKGLVGFFFAGLVGEDEFPRVCIAKALSAFKKKRERKLW